MSKYGLDKFYTKDDIVDFVLQTIDLNKYRTIIEPSAGNGAFSKKIKNCLAYDILPENENIIQCNFFELSINNNEHPFLIIGNPPFGRNGSVALSFIKRASLFADTIAFILPKSFKKKSFYNKIPLNFTKTIEIDIPDNSFIFENNIVNVPCVWQVYNKTKELRKKTEIMETDLFEFVKQEEANVSIRRVGVYAGKAFSDINKSKQSHYFVKVDNINYFIDKVNSIIWKHNNTVGPRSISKPELIEEINKIFDKN